MNAKKLDKGEMRELALFTGVGGGILATKWFLGWRTVCYVEKNPYCVEVLKARIKDGLLDDAPIWDDANTFDGIPWRGKVDVITAGFPCQPFSVAGKGKGENDERNGWPATNRIINNVRPGFVFLENVSNITNTQYFGRILSDLAQSWYDIVWQVLSARAVGAPHIRKRLWILAYTNRERQQQSERLQQDQPGRTSNGSAQEAVADSHCLLRKNPEQEGNSEGKSSLSAIHRSCVRRQWWEFEPELGRVAHGVAHRMDRLRAIGNGQVPAVVRRFWEVVSSG